MKEFFISNWQNIIMVICVGIGGRFLLRYLKSEQINKFAKMFFGFAVAFEKMSIMKIGKKSWDEWGEESSITLGNFIQECGKQWNAGILSNNIKVMMKKKMENTDEFKAMEKALEELKK